MFENFLSFLIKLLYTRMGILNNIKYKTTSEMKWMKEIVRKRRVFEHDGT